MLSKQEPAIKAEPVSLEEGLEEVFNSSDDPGTTGGVSTGDQGKISPNPFPTAGLKLSEAAGRFSVTVRTVQRWIKEGRLKARKIEGSHGPEWRVMGESSVDSQESRPTINSDDAATVIDFDEELEPARQATSIANESIERMAAIIERLTEQLESARKELQGASYRNGYLEAQVESHKEQIKLLTDSQHKRSKWHSFWSWFVSRGV